MDDLALLQTGFQSHRSRNHFTPSRKANEWGISDFDLVFRAFSELSGAQMGGSPSFKTLTEIVKAEESGMHLHCEMLGIDCTSPESARLKIYTRSRSTSFDDVKSVITLGGRHENEDHDTVLCDLYRLSHSLFSYKNPCLDRSTSLPSCDHRTAVSLKAS